MRVKKVEHFKFIQLADCSSTYLLLLLDRLSKIIGMIIETDAKNFMIVGHFIQ